MAYKPVTMILAGRVAIVTGAARGIGFAIASELALAGASVVLGDQREAEVKAAALTLTDRGLNALALAVNIATPEGNAALVKLACSTFGRLDIFHANAAIAPFVDLLQTNQAQIEETVAINLTGAIHGCAAALPHMTERRAGVILLTASIAAFVGDPCVPVYSATKGGLTALCKSVAVRHGPDGVRCVTICPGDVKTQMLKDYLAREPDPQAAQARMEQSYPLRRLIEPEEIGRLAVFLASDQARSITGVDIVIDAGLTARCY